MGNKNNDCLRVAELLRVSRRTVFELWKSGELGSVTIGRRRYSTDRQIDAYLARLEQAADALGPV